MGPDTFKHDLEEIQKRIDKISQDYVSKKMLLEVIDITGRMAGHLNLILEELDDVKTFLRQAGNGRD